MTSSAIHPPTTPALRISAPASKRDLAPLATVAASLLLAHTPLLVKFLADLSARPQYDFFPLVILGAACLIWDRVRGSTWSWATKRSRRVGALFMLLSVALSLLGAFLMVRWFAAPAAWIAIFGFGLWIGGTPLVKKTLPGLILLALIIPPPMRLDDRLALTLRSWAVFASGAMLDLLHVPNVVSGTLINIAGRRLGVEEACSGINSLMAVIAVTLMIGFWWRRPAWRIGLQAAVSVLFVIWANVFRIVIGALLQSRYQIDILSGSAHALLGLVLFLCCVGLAASFDQLVELFRPSAGRPSSAAGTQVSSDPAPPTMTSDSRSRNAWALVPVFLIAAVVSQFRVADLWRTSRLPTEATFTLPAELSGWQRVDGSEQVIGRAELLGQYSTLWNFRRGSTTALVAFDYPFPGFHDLQSCYGASGWGALESLAMTAKDEPVPTFRELHLQRPASECATVLFGLFDEQGRSAPLPASETASGFAFALKESRRVAASSPLYQVQVLVQGFQPTSPTQRQELRELFLAARTELARQLAKQVDHR